MSTALLKQTMLVTFKQTPVHTPNVLNEGQWYRKSETSGFFTPKIGTVPLQLDNVSLPKRRTQFSIAGLLHQPYNGDAWGLTHLYTSHFDVESRRTHFSHNKFLDYKETRRALNTPHRKEQAWLRQQGLTWYTDGSTRPSSFDTFFRLCSELWNWRCSNSLLLFLVTEVLQLLNRQLPSFADRMQKAST